MAVSAAGLQKLNTFRAQHSGQLDALLHDVKGNKAGAAEKLAEVVGLSKIDALDLAQNGIDALANDKGVQALLAGQQKTQFKADEGGKSAGGTLAAHGRFSDADIEAGAAKVAQAKPKNDPTTIKDTVIRRFKDGEVWGITPLVSKVPANPFSHPLELSSLFSTTVPKMKDPTDKWDVFPMGNEYTTKMCKDALSEVGPKVEEQLAKFAGSLYGTKVPLPVVDFKAALNPVIAQAAKTALETLPDNLEGKSPNRLRKHLANTIADKGAELVDNMGFPTDPERQFNDHDLKKHVMASVITGALAAFDLKDASALLDKHGASKTALGDGSLRL